LVVLLIPVRVKDDRLTQWIAAVGTAGLPHLHGLCNGLELDRAAVSAGFALPRRNGRSEGVDVRTEKVLRQLHGRAGCGLFRHRILLQ
jgi:transposase